MSHSGWMVAWCLTMSKSRCQVFLFRLTAKHFFLGLLLYLTARCMPGGHVWVTPCQKTATLPTSASLSLLSLQPQCCAIHGPASGPQPHVFFVTPTSRRTTPQTATHDESPHDHPGHAPFLWMHPGPSDMPSPLSMCCRHPTRIPHALCVPQPQPRPHACAAAPFDASDAFDVPPPSQMHPVCP